MPEDIKAELAGIARQLEEQLRFYREIGITDIGGAGSALESAATADSRAEAVLIVAPGPAEPAESEAVMPRKRASAGQAGLFGDISADDSAEAQPKGARLPVIEAQDATLEAIREDIGECVRCKLHEHRNNIVFGEGSPQAKLVFIGEGPGADEDATGRPFVGRAGQLLDKIIQAIGLKREEVYISNVVKCRPPGNRTPERDEVATCEQFLFRQLALIRPSVIVALGSPAFQCIMRTKETITRARGEWRDWNGIKVMPTFHPAYLLRSPDKKREAWDDMKKVRDYLNSLPDRE
ncbi:MAG TPA: uracil-DNA glycosylase [Blastocatellia bacterium]|nr:uracil-DNA glycosylase [Blastocatellia bacterium]